MKECIAYAVIDGDSVMAEKRTNPESGYYGLLIIPGGKVEDGESPGMAALREPEEEYGIRVISMVYLGDMTKNSLTSGNPIHFEIYLVTAFEGTPQNMEPDKGEFAWILLNTAKEYLQLESSQEIVDRIISYLNSESA